MVWVSLVHNGIAISSSIHTKNDKIEYKNQPINNNKNLSTALYLYSKHSTKTKDQVFKQNFLNSIKQFLPLCCKDIKFISELNFSKNKKIKTKTKSRSYNKYKYCFVNGAKEKIDRFLAEPSCIFIGRGKHNLRGTFKPGVKESDITINISKGYRPAGKWKSIIHNNNVDWIACWTDKTLNKIKYVYPSSGSKLKSVCTLDKFEFARKINKKISLIRKCYISNLSSDNEKDIQHAIATYFIDTQCLRCGTCDENNTYGCTTLQSKHIFINHNHIKLVFNGKDSIEFNKTFLCKYPLIIKYLETNLKKKSPSDNLFHLITSSSLNNYLNSIIENLTAKVFRTCHASSTFDKILFQSTSIDEFKIANKTIASLCNHTNLQTSKQNYLDPRIVFSFSNRNGIPIENLYSNQLILKFGWAKSTRSDFRF